MIMSSIDRFKRREVSKSRDQRIKLLYRLLRATGFVNVDTIYSTAGRQLIIIWCHPTAVPAPLLALIDPVLERWCWPVIDVWQSHEPLPYARLVQIRIDVVD